MMLFLFPRWRILPNKKTTSTADEISKGKTLTRRTLASDMTITLFWPSNTALPAPC